MESVKIITEDYIDDILSKSIDLTYKDVTKALSYVEVAFSYSKELNYKKGEAEAAFQMGVCYWMLGVFEKATMYNLHALDAQKNLKDKTIEVRVMNSLGNIFLDLRNYNKSLDYYLKALNGAKKINNDKVLTNCLNNIGELYKELKEYKKANEYYKESEKIAKKLDDKNIICILYLNQGEINYFLKDYDDAVNYINESQNIISELGIHHLAGEAYHYLALCYYKLNNYKKAADNFLMGIYKAEITKNKLYEVDIIIDMTDFLISTGLDGTVEKWLLKALKISKEIKNPKKISDVCKTLIEVNEKNNNFEKLHDYYVLYVSCIADLDAENDKRDLEMVKTMFKIDNSIKEKEEIIKKNQELTEKSEILRESYKNVKIISEIGKDITGSLNFEYTLTKLYKKINLLVDAYNFGIATYDEYSKSINYSLFIENGCRINIEPTSIYNHNSVAAYSIRTREVVFSNNIYSEISRYVNDVSNLKLFGDERKVKSLIYCPLIIENKAIGVMTVQSLKEKAYNEINIESINALASYVAIALNNANKSNSLKKLNRKLENLSNLDGLTGISNRRRLNFVLKKEWGRARRRKYPISLMIIDIDNFKEYNDNYGHLKGDDTIKSVAGALTNNVKRSSDLLARYGGDEFVILLPETNAEEAEKLAWIIFKAVASLKIVHDYSKISHLVTVSIGISSLIPGELNNWNDLFSRADKALYVAKQNGRSRFEIYKDI